MLIRKAENEDAGQISRVVSTVSESFITSDYSAAGHERLLKSMTPARIEEYLKTNYQYHVAEISGDIIGVVAVRDNCHLYHLFVNESYQRRGIGKKLWKTAMAVCRTQGNPGEFSVNSSPNALGFYETMGFSAQSGPNTKHGITSIPMKLETRITER